jgi:hypothetical protein
MIIIVIIIGIIGIIMGQECERGTLWGGNQWRGEEKRIGYGG